MSPLMIPCVKGVSGPLARKSNGLMVSTVSTMTMRPLMTSAKGVLPHG